MSFEYLDHPFAYKYVKSQAIVILKSRHAYLKKKDRKGRRSTMKLRGASLEPIEGSVGSEGEC